MINPNRCSEWIIMALKINCGQEPNINETLQWSLQKLQAVTFVAETGRL
jgi:hypothetical protein